MSLGFCIGKEITGTSQHLCGTPDGMSWVDEVPPDVWLLTTKPTERCLQTLLRLNGHDIEAQVPEKFIKSMKLSMRDDFEYHTVPWQQVLPAAEYRSFLTGLIQNVRNGLQGVDTTYYLETFSRVTPLFENLHFSAVDVPRLQEYLSDPKTVNPQTLKTFTPVAGSFANKVRYNRFGTRTGRLTMMSGPDILTLKREYRDVVISRFQGGRVRYLDFSSLEARVLLTAAGTQVDVKDIYGDIGKQLLPSKSRKVIKLIVLATVFGSGQAHLQRFAGLSEAKMSKVQTKIREMFGTEALEARLRTQWVEMGGKIKNSYGRVVNVPDESTLINSFVQSSAVDVALLGFASLADRINDLGLRAKPVFILHDAIIVDTPPDEVETLDSIIEPGLDIPGMSNRFFLDSSDLCT